MFTRLNRRPPAAVVVVLLLIACLNDPIGPGTLTVALEGGTADTVWSGAPGEAMPRIQIRIRDEAGRPVSGAAVTWEALGKQSGVTSVITQSSSAGEASALWLLGTDAAEEQRLHITVQTTHHEEDFTLRARAVPYVVSGLRVPADSVAVLRVGDTLSLHVNAVDPYGNTFPAPDVAASMSDTTMGSGWGQRVIGGPRRGWAMMIITSQGVGIVLPLHVTQFVTAIIPARDMLVFSSLGAQMPVSYVVRDDRGREVHDTSVVLTVSDTAIARIDGTQLRAVGQGGAALQLALGPARATVPVIVGQRIASLRLERDTIRFDALSDTTTLHPVARDSLGVLVTDAAGRTTYSSTDRGVIEVDENGLVHATGNGSALVVAQSLDGPADTVQVSVIQRPVRVSIAEANFLITAIGDTAVITATALDSLGFPVPGPVQITSVGDTSILEVSGPATVRARAAGTSVVALTVAGLQSQAVVEVTPVPAAIEAGLANPDPIQSIPLDSLIPLRCRVRDRNGNVIDSNPRVAASVHWSGEACGEVRGRSSGFDTIRVQAGSLEAVVPITLAIRPIVSSRVGSWLLVDSVPTGRAPWAPTARRNSRGEIEVYFAAYPVVGTTWDVIRADLHRLVSSDGHTFRYDGVVLQHDADVCAPQGSGIENVSIVPRADGPGWRMFFAAGSFTCYGWQVFSAVSLDERTWTKEPGVRLTNGGSLPPYAPIYAPWPLGEGMATDQLPSGEWRMIVGGYEQILPYEDKFQIVEWRSQDQLNWSYSGPVLTTRDMPPEGRGTIYSPTIREVTPGIWRMIFSGDDRREPGWRGRIWSAVSTDREAWQIEGELMGSPETKLWYASLVDDQLVFVREDKGAQRRLATATITMP